MTKEKLIKSFLEIFGEGDTPLTVFSPGRVNLIGEHTDYNGGHVFPCALTMGTWFAARKRNDRLVRCYSENFKDQGIIERNLDELDFDPEKGYTNYLLGLFWTFKKKGMNVEQGMDVFVSGNIPYGSGLSSSASIEVGMGLILKTMFDFPVSMQDIALFSQYSENNYNGLNCGIMDQFIIAKGEAGKAMYLDTATLNYENAPVDIPGMKIVIGCTNKKRGLTDSKYNERRAECEEALSILQKAADIVSLCELSVRDYEELKGLIKDPVISKRAKHAIYENERTKLALEYLQNGDIAGFGKLMNESHISLRDDYEVTGIELDTLVEEAWKIEGVLGSRMTGAGFGGCTVSIVKDEAIETFVKNVGDAYEKKIGYAADFYTAEIGSGAYVL